MPIKKQKNGHLCPLTILSLVPNFASETNGLNMDAENVKTEEQKEILALAENTKNSCDLLINQCDSWLSEEEGLKNLKESKKKRKDAKKMALFHLPLNICYRTDDCRRKCD